MLHRKKKKKPETATLLIEQLNIQYICCFCQKVKNNNFS